MIATFKKDEEKILVVVKGNEKLRFSVKNLLNENYEVDEQTLNQEKKMFIEPIKF